MNAVTLGIGGPGADGVTFPDGTALTIDGGSVMTLQLHLLNSSDSALDTAATRIDLDGQDDPGGLQPVGILVTASNAINLMPHTVGVQVHGGCTVPTKLENVFDGYLHMHTLGQTITVDITAPTAPAPDRILEANPWNFDEQKVYPLSSTVEAGSKLALTCTYDNSTDTTVVGGQLAANEMCVGILYFWPTTANIVPCFN